MAEYITKDKAKELVCEFCTGVGTSNCEECEHPVDDVPAEDLPSTFWTDDQIVGSEFLTHCQGGRGYEIHFRTDSREKYRAVENECRRQLGHAKPAADVQPVRHGRWVKPTRVPDSMLDECSICGFDCGAYTFNYCPNCGAKMDGEA